MFISWKKSTQPAIIASDTNIHFEQMAANIPKFLQIKNFIHRFHCDEFIMFVRLGHNRIYRGEVKCANGNTTGCCGYQQMSAGVGQPCVNNQSAVHLQIWHRRLSGNS